LVNGKRPLLLLGLLLRLLLRLLLGHSRLRAVEVVAWNSGRLLLRLHIQCLRLPDFLVFAVLLKDIEFHDDEDAGTALDQLRQRCL
jgi:hypothetical protein